MEKSRNGREISHPARNWRMWCSRSWQNPIDVYKRQAVGSTGQSQGIYIQFLVAVVNYITSIYAGNTDPVELRKVIFIDNPFGAAKDIYIWEPIFQLLKNNHVQLLVPARGATPAITGRFEVNYILGQKFISGRQQTVVVDYRSQTEEAELEYIPISYEQEQLQLM